MKRRLQDTFDKIHTEHELKNRTMEFLAHTTNGYRDKKTVPVKWLAVAAACFVLLMTAGIGYLAYLTPAFAISIDINPSIELGINRFNKVVSVDTYNEDGAGVMAGMNIYHLDYKEALEMILADKGMKEYMMQDHLIAVTVFGRNESKNNEMIDNVVTCTSPYADVRCSSGNAQEIRAAHEAGMSFGKYKVFLELQALDPDIKAEDVQGFTMCQIWDMIDELSGNMDRTDQNDNTGRYRRGQHNGCGSGRGRGNGKCWQESGGK